MLDGNVLLRQKRDEVPKGTLSCPDRIMEVFYQLRHYEGSHLLPSVCGRKLIQQTLIIFDDFTTDSKFVDFPFKVKSSAMKILHVNEDVNIQYVCWFMSITRLIGDTHKRYWISEYSKLHIPIPPRKEQDIIINKVNELFKILDNISAEL